MYGGFQLRMAKLGFCGSVLTVWQYDRLIAAGCLDDEIDSIASDVAAGFTLQEAFDYNATVIGGSI